MPRPKKDPKESFYLLMKKNFEEALKRDAKAFDLPWILYQEVVEAEEEKKISKKDALKLKIQLAKQIQTDIHQALSSSQAYLHLLRKTGFLKYYNKIPEEPAWEEGKQ